jgi:hypothetical protein
MWRDIDQHPKVAINVNKRLLRRLMMFWIGFVSGIACLIVLAFAVAQFEYRVGKNWSSSL